MTWNIGYAASLVCALAVGACGGSDNANDERRAQQAPDMASTQGTQAAVTLTGCLEGAPGTNQLVLQRVQFEPRQGTNMPPGITEGSWVHLEGAEPGSLKAHAGQRVSVTGVIVDDGRNTIGTAGTSGNPVAGNTGDRSRAAGSEHYSSRVADEAGRIARESMADGTAARLRVSEMAPTGQPCDAAEGEERR